MVRLSLLLLALCSMPASAQELTYAQAKARADADEARLLPAGTDALHAAYGRMWEQVRDACPLPEEADPPPFTVVMELDADGDVVRTWLWGDSPLALCAREEFAGATLILPPLAPFFTSFELSWKPE